MMNNIANGMPRDIQALEQVALIYQLTCLGSNDDDVRVFLHFFGRVWLVLKKLLTELH